MKLRPNWMERFKSSWSFISPQQTTTNYNKQHVVCVNRVSFKIHFPPWAQEKIKSDLEQYAVTSSSLIRCRITTKSGTWQLTLKENKYLFQTWWIDINEKNKRISKLWWKKSKLDKSCTRACKKRLKTQELCVGHSSVVVWVCRFFVSNFNASWTLSWKYSTSSPAGISLVDGRPCRILKRRNCVLCSCFSFYVHF